MRGQPPVLRARDAQRARERLEHRLDLMVARSAVQHLHVHVGARALREALEEVLTSSDCRSPTRSTFSAGRRRHAAGRRDRSPRRQRFVHRHHEVAGAIDAAAVAERLRHRFAERDADVFDGVMLIDVEVAGGASVRSKPPCRVTSSSM